MPVARNVWQETAARESRGLRAALDHPERVVAGHRLLGERAWCGRGSCGRGERFFSPSMPAASR